MTREQGTKTAVQYLKFMVIGSVNAVISYIVYSIVIFFGGHYALANIMGFIVSVLSSYLINSRFVFERDEGLPWWKVLLRLYVCYAFTGLILTNVLSWLWLDVLMLEEGVSEMNVQLTSLGLKISDRKLAEYIAPLINVCITTPINFVINKFWAYKKIGSGKSADKVPEN